MRARPTEFERAAEAAVEALVSEVRDMDANTGAAHALQVGVPALAELDVSEGAGAQRLLAAAADDGPETLDLTVKRLATAVLDELEKRRGVAS